MRKIVQLLGYISKTLFFVLSTTNKHKVGSKTGFDYLYDTTRIVCVPINSTVDATEV